MLTAVVVGATLGLMAVKVKFVLLKIHLEYDLRKAVCRAASLRLAVRNKDKIEFITRTL